MGLLRNVLVALALAGAWTAHAQDECDRTSLKQGELPSEYLVRYANACVKVDDVNARLEAWGIPPKKQAGDRSEPGPEVLLLRMVPAWRDIAAELADLAKQVSPGHETLRDLLGQIAERARITAEDAQQAVELRSQPDVSAFGRVAWNIPRNLVLLEVPRERKAPLPYIPVNLEIDRSCEKDVSSFECREALALGKKLVTTWSLGRRLGALASAPVLEAVGRSIEAKESLWNTYLYDSKPMLPLDFVATDFMTGGWSTSDQFRDGFREPPKTQWFLLHPGVAAEYASTAKDGEQLKPVLYVELLGINRWNERDRIDAPLLRELSGVSFIRTFADREGVRDSGYGVLLTLNNVYSLAYTVYGSKKAVLMSFDLASLWREKYKPRYEKYKNQFQDLKLP